LSTVALHYIEVLCCVRYATTV